MRVEQVGFVVRTSGAAGSLAVRRAGQTPPRRAQRAARVWNTARSADDEEEEDREPEDAELGGDLQPRRCGSRARLDAPLRVPVLEIARRRRRSADSRRTRRNDSLEQRPPRLRGSEVVLALVGDARDATPVRCRHERAARRARRRRRRARRRAACERRRRPSTSEHRRAKPRNPPREPEATIAPIMHTAQPAAAARLTSDPGCGTNEAPPAAGTPPC